MVNWLAENNQQSGAGLYDSWANYDPEAALRHLLVADPGEAPHKAGIVVKNWVTHEPEEASIFVRDQMDPSPARDAAIRSLINASLSEDDVEAARLWAETISDTQMRVQFLDRIDNPPDPLEGVFPRTP
jgi:hypothetical protein